LKDTILKHQNLSKVDLSNNLIPLKVINEIEKHCAIIADRSELKGLPGLKREFRKQKQNRVDPNAYDNVKRDYDTCKVMFEDT
jgi:hypothetical protein